MILCIEFAGAKGARSSLEAGQRTGPIRFTVNSQPGTRPDVHQRKPLAFVPALFKATRKRKSVPLEEATQETGNSASNSEGAPRFSDGGASACERPYVSQEIVLDQRTDPRQTDS